MKYALVILLVLDLMLVSGAIFRLFTSKPDTPPFVSFSTVAPSEKRSAAARPKPPTATDSTAASPESSSTAGDTTRRDVVVDHLRGSRAGEMEETATISTTNPQGNAEYNTDKALERAASIDEGREADLDDAKSKIGQIGK